VKLMGILLHFFLCMCQEVIYIMVTSPTNINTLFAKEVHNVLLILSCFCHWLTSAPVSAVPHSMYTNPVTVNNSYSLFHTGSKLFLGKVNVVSLQHDNQMSCVLLKATYWQKSVLTFIRRRHPILSELHLTKATRNLNVPYTHAEA